MSVVPLHPRHKSPAEYARAIYPSELPNFSNPEVREFVVRRQIALETKRRSATLDDHTVAKRIALAALREGASADASLRAARRYLDTVAPRARPSTNDRGKR